MYLRFILVCLLFNLAFGATNSQNLDVLMNKINQVNQDLSKKTQQQKSLDNAISDSRQAIDQSLKALTSLRQTRNADMEQLKQISTILPQIESATSNIQTHVKNTVSAIYQQIKTIQLESSSILSGNDVQLNNRKQQYLIRLLRVEANKYQKLQTKLDELTKLNTKLNYELVRLDKQLGATIQKSQQFQQNHQDTLSKKQKLEQQINQEQQQLSGLQQKQAVLGILMKSLDKDLGNNPVNNKQAKPNNLAQSTPKETSSETLDGSPLFERKLVKPLNNQVLIPFGVMRQGVRNNGVVYQSKNAPVFAISDGKVAYVGILPGLGNVIVVNHGDNYMSVYAGVIPKASKGQSVSSGQIIANSGQENNQPMGGVYFELRHFGKPVNPRELVE
jgi:septal ring factor EnvC (AmiA/AmiB activator)